jgi:hypothetical protein
MTRYQWFFKDVSIKRAKRGETISHFLYLIKHDITDSAIRSFDIEKTQAIVSNGLFYVLYGSQVLHLI